MEGASLIACTRCAVSKARCDRKVSHVTSDSSTQRIRLQDHHNDTASNIASRYRALNVSQKTTCANQGAHRAGHGLLESEPRSRPQHQRTIPVWKLATAHKWISSVAISFLIVSHIIARFSLLRIRPYIRGHWSFQATKTSWAFRTPRLQGAILWTTMHRAISTHTFQV